MATQDVPADSLAALPDHVVTRIAELVPEALDPTPGFFGPLLDVHYRRNAVLRFMKASKRLYVLGLPVLLRTLDLSRMNVAWLEGVARDEVAPGKFRHVRDLELRLKGDARADELQLDILGRCAPGLTKLFVTVEVGGDTAAYRLSTLLAGAQVLKSLGIAWKPSDADKIAALVLPWGLTTLRLCTFGNGVDVTPLVRQIDALPDLEDWKSIDCVWQMGPSDFPAAAAKLSLVETVVRFDMLGRLLAHPGFRPRVLAFGFMQHYVAGNKTLPAAYGKAMSLPSVEELHVNDAATKATFASGIPPNLRRLSIRPNDLDLRKKEREAVRRMLAERAERARAIEVQFVLRELLLFMHDNPDPEVRFWESVPGVKIELVKEEEDFF